MDKCESSPELHLFSMFVSKVKRDRPRCNSLDVTGSNTFMSNHSLLDLTTTNPKPERRYSNLQQELNSILGSKDSCKQFKAFLKSKKCDENLYFYIDASIYANLMATPPAQLSAKVVKKKQLFLIKSGKTNLSKVL
jgi:hypothetical protein